MANAEDIAKVVAAVLKELKGKQHDVGGGGKSRSVFDERLVRKVDKLDGQEKAWKDWRLQLKAAMGAADQTASLVMDYVEKEAEYMTPGDIVCRFVDGGSKDADIDKLSEEFYDLLCSVTSGEAMTIVRDETTMCGFLFRRWRICQRYAPTTPARTMAALMGAMNPPQHKNVHLMHTAIDLWTMKINLLSKGHGDMLSGNMKKAVLLSMLPSGLQDMVY
jgi:hypothetical protein